MLFHLKPDTECELTSFVGRTQKSGPDDVPAVTFRLKLGSVRNDLLDLFSPTMRHTVYAPVEGQEQLPGVEITTPILRSKDLKHWTAETRLEGWSVIVARGISDDSALQMGNAKLDDFRFDFFEGGHMDVEFRVSTADVDEDGAGMLWGRQKCKVFATIVAPELPAAAIDGTNEAFERDHPPGDDATDLFASGSDQRVGGPDGPDDDGGEDDTDSDLSPDLEARVQAAIDTSNAGRTTVATRSPAGSRTARGREKTKAALSGGAAR